MTNRLNPGKILSDLTDLVDRYSENGELMPEVEMRRTFSTLYFALFNYWSEVYYHKLNKRGGGKGGDYFSHKEFSRYVLANNLSTEYVILFMFRVFSDHYLLNPGTIEIKDQYVKGVIVETIQIKFSYEAVRDALIYANSILRLLDTME